jgi:hypothetical protein
MSTRSSSIICISLILLFSGCFIAVEPEPLPPDPLPPEVVYPDPEGYCGDSQCEYVFEDYLICPEDCAPYCGDGMCSPDIGENMWTCWPDCSPEPYRDEGLGQNAGQIGPSLPGKQVQIKYRKEFITDPPFPYKGQ